MTGFDLSVERDTNASLRRDPSSERHYLIIQTHTRYLRNYLTIHRASRLFNPEKADAKKEYTRTKIIPNYLRVFVFFFFPFSFFNFLFFLPFSFFSNFEALSQFVYLKQGMQFRVSLFVSVLLILLLVVYGTPESNPRTQNAGLVFVNSHGYKFYKGSVTVSPSQSSILDDCYSNCRPCVCGNRIDSRSPECSDCIHCSDYVWHCDDTRPSHDDNEIGLQDTARQIVAPTFAFTMSCNCSGNTATNSDSVPISQTIRQLTDCRRQMQTVTCTNECLQTGLTCSLNCPNECTTDCAATSEIAVCIACITACFGECNDSEKTCESQRCPTTQE